MEMLLSDFNNLISNGDTPDLSLSGAFASLDEKFVRSTDKLDSILSPADTEISPKRLVLEEQKMR